MSLYAANFSELVIRNRLGSKPKLRAEISRRVTADPPRRNVAATRRRMGSLKLNDITRRSIIPAAVGDLAYFRGSQYAATLAAICCHLLNTRSTKLFGVSHQLSNHLWISLIGIVTKKRLKLATTSFLRIMTLRLNFTPDFVKVCPTNRF